MRIVKPKERRQEVSSRGSKPWSIRTKGNQPATFCTKRSVGFYIRCPWLISYKEVFFVVQARTRTCTWKPIRGSDASFKRVLTRGDVFCWKLHSKNGSAITLGRQSFLQYLVLIPCSCHVLSCSWQWHSFFSPLPWAFKHHLERRHTKSQVFHPLFVGPNLQQQQHQPLVMDPTRKMRNILNSPIVWVRCYRSSKRNQRWHFYHLWWLLRLWECLKRHKPRLQ